MPAGRLDVTVLGAKDLKNTQILGSQDPFFIVQVGDKHFASAPASDSGRSPTWNARFSFDTKDEDRICFTIRNRNVLTSDSHIGDVVINLHTVYSEGKHDAVAQVLTESGRPQGELSVILLFTPYDAVVRKPSSSSSTSVPNKDTPQITPGSPGGYPIRSSMKFVPTGYGTNTGRPTNAVPSAPPVPMASHVPVAQTVLNTPPVQDAPPVLNTPQAPIAQLVPSAPVVPVTQSVPIAPSMPIAPNVSMQSVMPAGYQASATVPAPPQQTMTYLQLPQSPPVTPQMQQTTAYYPQTMIPQQQVAIVPQTQVAYQSVAGFAPAHFAPQTGLAPTQNAYSGAYATPNYPMPPPGGGRPAGYH